MGVFNAGIAPEPLQKVGNKFWLLDGDNHVASRAEPFDFQWNTYFRGNGLDVGAQLGIGSVPFGESAGGELSSFTLARKLDDDFPRRKMLPKRFFLCRAPSQKQTETRRYVSQPQQSTPLTL